MVRLNDGFFRETIDVLGTPIDVVDWKGALSRISGWATKRESRYVCICNVHSVITAHSEADFGEVLRGSDMNTSDGAPIAWFLRREGCTGQQRINGPDLMWMYLSKAEASGEAVFFFGSTDDTLSRLKAAALNAFPALIIAGALSPPFRKLSTEEDAAIVEEINASGATTVWVSLGCPKQENWMAAHRGRINGVMVGVGAAFDYHAGTIERAPKWMRDRGLEWSYRLIKEPRRLFVRYATTNSAFIRLVAQRELTWGFRTRMRRIF